MISTGRADRGRWFLPLLLVCWIGCGRDVDIGRYQTDAGNNDGGPADSGGSGGSGGAGGHDECAEFEPVCGSDGVTYRNRCVALLAGITSVTRGACR